jgi:hypothetical protein
MSMIGTRSSPASTTGLNPGGVVQFLVLLLFLLAVRSGESQSLTLRELSLVVLQEDESRFVGEPTGLAQLANGGFLVSDRRNGVIHEFRPDGAYVAARGRRGTGPLEWESGPHSLHLADASTLFVSDGGRVVQVSLPDWKPVRVLAKPTGTSLLVAATPVTVVFSRVDGASRTSLLSVDVATGARTVGGPWTSQLSRGSVAVAQMMSFSGGTVLPDGRLAVAIQHSDSLYVGPFVGGPFERVNIPVGARRGARVDLVGAVRDDNPASVERAVYQSSSPETMGVLDRSGKVAIVFNDYTMRNRRMTSALRVSMVDVTARRACPDVSVPVPADPRPIAAVANGKLLVVVQEELPTGELRTVIRQFTLQPAGCA